MDPQPENNENSEQEVRNIFEYNPFDRDGEAEGASVSSTPAEDSAPAPAPQEPTPPPSAETPPAPDGRAAAPEAPAPEAPSPPSSPTPEAPVPPEQQAQPDAQAPIAPEPPKPPSEVDRLTALVERQAQTIERLMQGQGQQQQPQEPQGPQVPEYRYNLPGEVIDALASEDPNLRAQALQSIVVGVSQTVHQRVAEEMREWAQQYVPQTVQQITSTKSAQKSVAEDFYGTYRNLDQEWLKPSIKAIANEVVNEMGATTWSPQVRDAVAERVYRYMPHLRPQPNPGNGQAGAITHPPAAAPQAAPAVPAVAAPALTPATQVLPGARPEVPGAQSLMGANTESDIVSTLWG